MPNSSVLAEAFWHLLSQPHILRLFAATFVVAVSLPFAVAYGYRLWRVLRARWLVVPPSKESKQKVADETGPIFVSNFLN
jgi:hypothetical protein